LYIVVVVPINVKERVKMTKIDTRIEYQRTLPTEGIMSIKMLATYFEVPANELYEGLIREKIPVLEITNQSVDGLVNMGEIYSKTVTKRSHSAVTGDK
jgi:hypothetical protein